MSRTTLFQGSILACCILLEAVSQPGCTIDRPSGPVPGPTVEDRVEELLARMTLAEKVGQMAQVERSMLAAPQDIIDYNLGSLLSGGGSSPSSNTPQAWADMYDGFQALALNTRLGIPLLYGIDAVHGHNNVRGAVIFPHNIGMGATRNPELVRQASAITAREVAGTGIDWTFSPCIAVPRDERWGRTYEGFGETAEITRSMAYAAVKGYQGDDLGNPETILACAKHFVGDGGTVGGDDQGNTVADEATLRAIHLPGYVAAIEAGVGSIMASYSSWNGVKVHGHAYLLTEVLKRELGFKGFVISDWGGIDQLPGTYAEQVRLAINSGIDMVMIPGKYREFIPTLIDLVQKGDVLPDRIDDAVRRILRQKFLLGLFDQPMTNRALTGTIGSAAHREVARECVRQSLVLLKNEGGILPLSRSDLTIAVAGKKADDLGAQCGGWSISWQGSSGDITTGTTIFEAVRNAVDEPANVVFTEDGLNTGGASVAIVVVGEYPYAEGAGDDQDLALSAEDMAVISRVSQTGVPMIVILLSGRPMIIGQALIPADAFIAAWLPGTEGDGVADVLFGSYAPTGKLPHSWPRERTQIPINEGDAAYDPLFPLGYGMTY